MRATPLLTLMILLASPATAQDASAPAKRSEGRYFVEVAEIMLNANEFDMEIGSIVGSGARAGEPSQALSRPEN